jgi:predicted MPP superfamily phosphohydrolase
MKKPSVIEKEIIIPGLKKTYRILHITDVHIIAWNENDESNVITEGHHTGKKLISDFGERRVNVFTANGVTTNEKFEKLCDSLRECTANFADIVVFTGDILDFYTDTAFDFMMENLNKLTVPYMFVLGNHDYIFSNHSEQETFTRFDKLCGGNHRIQKLKLGELTLIGSFNGEYEYDIETKALVEEAIEGEKNVIMFQHVPINSPHVDEYISKRGVRNYLIGGKDCPAKSNCYEWIMKLIGKENSPIHALICGDSHFNYEGPLTDNVMQFVSPLLRDSDPVLFTVKGE